MKSRRMFWLIICLMATAAFTGCDQQPNFPSPASAAVQAIYDMQMPKFRIDEKSEKVLALKEEGDITLVVISFTGTRQNSGAEACLFTVETSRSGFGWISGNNSGNCVPNPPPPDQPPISFNFGHGGDSQGGPGYTSFSGVTLVKNISVVQLTWNDGKVEKVDSVDGHFFTTRTGDFKLQKIDVFDAEMKAIYSHAFQ